MRYRIDFNVPFPSFARFEETRLEGLTSRPIVLRSYYSQTRSFGWEGQNGWDEFVFEPRLEPDIAPELIGELKVQDIRRIMIHFRPGANFAGYTTQVPYVIRVMGSDGTIRPLAYVGRL